MKPSAFTCWITRALFSCVLLFVIGCGESPTEPTASRPPTPVLPQTNVYGNVYAEAENNCASDAVVEVLDGPKAGLRVVQDYKTCVEEGNGWFSFEITGLTPQMKVRIRASAPGYVSQERSVTPDGAPQRFVLAKQ